MAPLPLCNVHFLRGNINLFSRSHHCVMFMWCFLQMTPPRKTIYRWHCRWYDCVIFIKDGTIVQCILGGTTVPCTVQVAPLSLHAPLALPPSMVLLGQHDLQLRPAVLLVDVPDFTLVHDHRVRESLTVENLILNSHHQILLSGR